MPSQQEQRDPSEDKQEPQLVDLRGAGGEGVGKKKLLQRQQLPQSLHPLKELQSADCCACRDG